MKRIMAYLAGVVTVMALAYRSGPEAIIQTGLRLQAAQQAYDWHAVPKETVAVSYDTRELLAYEAPKPVKKGRK